MRQFVWVAAAPDVPLVREERELSAPGARQVLVKIAASGLNPLDTKIRAGKAGHAQQPLPAVLGLDMAGTVAEIGADVTRWKPGDAVYGMVGGVGGSQGTQAEFVVADAEHIAPKPANLSMREAAALPLVAITAWEGLVDHARVHAGHKVLVHAGAGGVGHVAVQIARAYGAEVFATVSPAKMETVRGWGATPIDYTAMQAEEYVQRYTGGEGFDVVYDTLGGATLDASFTAVRRYTGRVVSALGWGTHALAPLSFRAGTYSGVFTLMPLLTGAGKAHHGEILTQVTALVEAGKLRPLLNARRFSFAEIEDAYASVAAGAVGKVVLEY